MTPLRSCGALAAAFLALVCGPAVSASDLGFVAHFADLDKHQFGSTESTVVAMPSGGVGGVGEGWLSIKTTFVGNLGAQTATVELTGDHVASGATGVTFWMRDTGNDDNLEIHVGVGKAGGTVYLSKVGINPPSDRWARYHVDFTNPNDWTRIKGNGNFQTALSTSDRLLFRHDLLPLTSSPNNKMGDFGLDRVALTPCDYEVDGIDAGGSNVLALDTLATTQIDTTHTWVGMSAPPLAQGFVLLSAVPADLALFGGRLFVDPGLSLLLPVTSDALGVVSVPLPVPNDPALVGGTIYGQFVARDNAQVANWALSNQLSATLCD